jgi:LPS-assembly protein
VYSPYRDQNNIWNFDSALADFDLSRIYSENLFTGRDRISSANQATIGATSRWLAQDTGEELFQITAAQRHYFTEQRVTLPGGSINTDRKSDVLLSASGQIAPQFYMDAFGQYNVDNGKLLKTDFSLRWQPAPKKVINIGFNDNRILATPTRTAYISGQWPLTPISKNLYGVARVNYNLEEKHLADAFVGFEYLKDCWIFRIVGQRTISSTRKADNSVFFQLELKGLGALGNDPDKVISDGVAGYSDIKFVDEEIEPAPLKQSNR